MAATEAPTSAPAAGSDETHPMEPEVIPIGDLAARGQELDQFLRSIRSNSHPTARGFRKLQSEIGNFLTEVDQLREDPEFEIRPELTAGAVDSIDEAWRDTAAKLRGWELVLSRRTAAMESLLTELHQTQQLWSRTAQNSGESLPNADLISKEVVNWTLTDHRRRLELPVGVGYGTDPTRVIDLLTRTASSHPDVLKDPAPRAIFLGFGDSSLNFSVRFWTANFDEFPQVRSDVGIRVCAALADAGIAVPFPQRDVNLRSLGDAVRETRGERS